MHFYGAAFDRKSLGRELLASDHKIDSNLSQDTYRDALLTAAEQQGKSGFGVLRILSNSFRGSTIYKCPELSQELIIRRLRRNIRRFIRRRGSDRETIVKSLRAVFSDGHGYRIYKLDIKSFYESIDRGHIASKLAGEMSFPPASKKVFHFFSDELARQNVAGLPRGMSVSATLSEYLMQDVDSAIKDEPEVYFYARYVDDILIVTTGAENRKRFYRKIQRHLPNGLELNRGKCRVIDLFRSPVKQPLSTPEETLDFLGYSFTIFGQGRVDNSIERRVVLDIAPKKVKRLKTRICLAFLQFTKDGLYSDLRDRISLLTFNYNLYDTDKNIRRNVGLYWNYRFVDLADSTALPELDVFLRRLLLSKSGNLAIGINAKLSTAQKAELLSISFTAAFRNKTFKHFGAGRLAYLARCWAYE